MRRFFTHPRTDLPWLLSVQLVAFLGFHLTFWFNNTFWFAGLTFQQYDGLGLLVGFWGFWLWTLGTALYLIWSTWRAKHNRLLCAAFAAVTFYGFWEYRYPAVTTLLYHLDHVEHIAQLFLDTRPPLRDLLELRKGG